MGANPCVSATIAIRAIYGARWFHGICQSTAIYGDFATNGYRISRYRKRKRSRVDKRLRTAPSVQHPVERGGSCHRDAVSPIFGRYAPQNFGDCRRHGRQSDCGSRVHAPDCSKLKGPDHAYLDACNTIAQAALATSARLARCRERACVRILWRPLGLSFHAWRIAFG